MYYIAFGWFWLWYVLHFFFKFFSCPCMGIYVSVQYNGGLVVRLVSHMRSSETMFRFPIILCVFLYYIHALVPLVSFLVDQYLV